MPTLYRPPLRKSNKRDPQFARGFARNAHPKSQWVIEDPEFQDHPPRRLGEVVNEVVAETGLLIRLRNWTNGSANALPNVMSWRLHDVPFSPLSPNR